MSYERDVIPAYSSPDIRVDDIKCGDSKYHNNARVLREFAQAYLTPWLPSW